jgi:hypothetical protein
MQRTLLIGIALMVGGVMETHAGDWQRLFDGVSLDGWRAIAHPESFRVQDGTIAAGGGPMDHLIYEGSVSNHDFRDFELELEVKALPGSNGGVFFHTEPQQGALKKGYEAQICDSYPDKRKTGSLVDVVDLETSPVSDGEWYTYRISVQDKTISIAINGKTVVHYDEPPQPQRKKGRERRLLSHGMIALQAHDPKSMVFYKNIRIRILPPRR